jgi:hypothetical protein
MTLRILGAGERLAASRRKDTISVLGQYGVGKTSLVKTLPPDETLFIDVEAGMAAVRDWPGDTIEVRDFRDAIDVACLIGGANSALRPADFFSAAHYEHVSKSYAGIDLARYRTIFIDSVTELTYTAFQFARTTPAAVSEKTGRDDLRGVYGELGRHVIELLRHMQHAPGKNVIFVGRLERVLDDYGREIWQPQMVGARAARELPGIVDHVITMSQFDRDAKAGWLHNADKGGHRGFVCWKLNPWGLPAKTRSSKLDLVEEPHLGRLLEKINSKTEK